MIDLMPGFGAFTPAVSGGLLDGSELDGTQLFAGDAAMTSGWTGTDASLTANAVLAPNGATDGASAVENTSNSRHIVYQQKGSLTADATFRFSVYAKQNVRRYLQLIYTADNGTAGSTSAYFDLQAGAVTDTDVIGAAQSIANATIQAAVNGYYKCSCDVRLSATTTAVYAIFALSNVGTYGAPLDSDSPQYTGDGTSGAYLWRPKLVQL